MILNSLRPVLLAFMIEGRLALGAEGKIMGPVLRDTVFGPAVEALHDEFVQRGMAPAADRPLLQSVSYDAVLLPASEAADNKVVLKHLDSRVRLLVGRSCTIQCVRLVTVAWRSLWCLPFPVCHEGEYILQGVHHRLLWPTW